MTKPALNTDAITALVADVMGERPSSVERLVEGLESQAFRVHMREGDLVLRVNPALRGFEKDRWAASRLAPRVPVPPVVELGWLDGDHAYCISEWMPGVTLQELSAVDAEAVVDEVAEIWRLVSEGDVSGIGGFGEFDPGGRAPAESWREVLAKTAEDARRELGLEHPDLIDAYERLLDACPEERGLIHGDFGSNNVLTDRGRITAVLDWDVAKVGDPLYDVANCYFWASHLPCMRVQASQFQRTLSDLPAYGERVLCYALRIGLEEAMETAQAGDICMSTWALERSGQLVRDLSS